MYAWCVERINPEKMEEWLFQLNQPLPGRETKVSDSDRDADAQSFLSVMHSQAGS